MTSFFAKAYIKYSLDIYPKIKKVRGSHRLLKAMEKLSQRTLEKITSAPEPLTDLKADNILILDGARADEFAKISECEKRISMGSMSQEFIKKNFRDHDWSDTVCITANPYYEEKMFEKLTGRQPEDVFHAVFHSWQNEWNEKEQTVLAEDVAETARTASKLFPDKKLLIHFMQPHIPFVGWETEHSYKEAILEEERNEKLWEKAMRGEISRSKIIQGYRMNLEYVLEEAENLIEDLEGKSVITADHGTFLGENGLYKHPEGSNAKVLRKVPVKYY